MLEAKKEGVCCLKAVTTVKTKKRQIRSIRFGVIVPLNLEGIDEVDQLVGSNKWRIAFNLEYSKLSKILIFREMIELQWKLGIFQFCLLHFIFEIKHNGHHKVYCIARGNRIKVDGIDTSAMTM